MKRTGTVLTMLVLSSAIAFAQGGGAGGGGSGGASGGGASAGGTSSGAGTSSTPGSATTGPNNPGGSTPGLSPESGTTGRAPGVNPANSQDLSRRSNPSDRTLPNANNPQDSRPFDSGGTPQIIAPERR